MIKVQQMPVITTPLKKLFLTAQLVFVVFFIQGLGLLENSLAAQISSSDSCKTYIPAQPVKDNIPASRQKVYVFEVEEEIFPPAERKFDQALEQAEEWQADILLMKLDTYGGAVDVADRMRTALVNREQLTIVYIENNAASAGALLSIACDQIYMNPIATIGAATVVDEGGTKAPEKYQSYFREKFRTTASRQGRNPDIAEAMVDENVCVKGIISKGRLLTFSADSAMKYHYCDGVAGSVEEVLALAGIENYEMKTYVPTLLDKIIGFFTHPIVSSLLLTVIFFGLFFELQSPGVGFPLIAAILAALAYFTPLYLDGFAENWEIGLFLLGLVLIGLEIFVIPGFGVAGISGIGLVFIGLVISMLGNVQFDFTPIQPHELTTSLVVVISAFILTVLGGALIGRYFYTSPIFDKLILRTTQEANEGYDVDSFKGGDFVGKAAIAATDLRPSGKVELDGETYDAYSPGDYILKGEAVIIKRARGTALLVEKLEEES